ncbi:MAG: polyhydroxyalkanoate synthesis regulator [Armatimonadota bacterium]
MTITEMLKKTMSFGLGAAAFSIEKIKNFTEEMVEKGEMTNEEAKKVIDDFSKKIEEDKNNVQSWMKQQAEKIIDQAGAARAEKVEELEKRVAELEAMLKDHKHEDCCH